MHKSMKRTLLYLMIILLGCRHDECIHGGKGITYMLDTTEFKKIPYKDNDTLIFKLVSVGQTLYFYGGKWEYGYEPNQINPCILTNQRQYRQIKFTTHTWEPVDGMTIKVKHFIPSDSKGPGSLEIWFDNHFLIPINKIGAPFQENSILVQGKTYSNVNFFPNEKNDPYPFGCFYNEKYGIIKVHRIDWDNPIPSMGVPFELVK